MSASIAPWLRIQRFFQETRRPIQLLVAHTADAAAAALTLSALLGYHLIPFHIHPAADYAEVRELVREMNALSQLSPVEDSTTGDEDSELFLLVGLGAPVDVATLFDKEKNIVIILDSHRSVHLANLRNCDDKRLLLWGAERIKEEVETFFAAEHASALRKRKRREAARRRVTAKATEAPRRQHAYGGEEPSVAGHSESGSDASAAENDVDVDVADDFGDASSDASSEEEDDMEYADTPSYSQEQRDKMSWMSETLPPTLRRRYESVDCAGKSCALEVYDIADALHRQKDVFLWHAAVGVCDLFQRRLIDYATYLKSMRRLHDTVTLRSSVRRGRLEDAANEEAGPVTAKDAGSTMTLANSDEAQLFLLRHYSLWGAVWNDTVSASLLKLHRVDDGDERLRLLLAKCGVSVEMARRPWSDIKSDERREVLKLVLQELNGLAEASPFPWRPYHIRSITRTTGFSAEVSTFDACNLFTALLGAVPVLAGGGAAAPTPEDTVGAAAEAATACDTPAAKLRSFYRSQFWRAYDVIDADPNGAVFRAAVESAKNLRKAIASATSALLQPGIIQSTTGLHYSQLSDPSRTTVAAESFWTPYRLEALAERLLYTLAVDRVRGRFNSIVRPVLLTCAMPAAFTPAALSELSGAAFLLNAVGSEAAPVTGAAESDEQSAGHSAAVNRWNQPVTLSGARGGLQEVFTVVLMYDRSPNGSLKPLPTVSNLIGILEGSDYANPPQRTDVRRNILRIHSRDAALHFAEEMHLLSLA